MLQALQLRAPHRIEHAVLLTSATIFRRKIHWNESQYDQTCSKINEAS